MTEGLDWLNYFSSKRSDMLNAIIGVWVGFVFGFTSIMTANENIKTILAILAFCFIILNITLFFYLKYQFYGAWEKKARKNEIKENDLILFEEKKFPDGTTKTNPLYPKNVCILLILCSIWVVFLTILLFWEHPPDNLIMKLRVSVISEVPILDDFFLDPPLGEWGIRHNLFLIAFISWVILSYFLSKVKNEDKQEEEKKKKERKEEKNKDNNNDEEDDDND